MKRQSWITYASNDVEGLKALVLSRSLRHLITRRLISVFVGQDVSEEIYELLECEFDRCIRITNKYRESRYPNFDFATVAKIHAYRLVNLERFIFLGPDSFVLRNSDELFVCDGLFDGDMFISTPSDEVFNQLVSSSSSAKLSETNEPQLSMQRFQEICSLKVDSSLLNGKYTATMNFQKGTLIGNGAEMNILRFQEGHPLDFFLREEKGGIETRFPVGTLHRAVYNACLEHLPPGIENAFPVPIRNKLAHLLSNPALPLLELGGLKDSVAIVGIGMRLPQANTLEEFWELIVNGRDGITVVPPGRWTPERCFNRMENSKFTQAGFLKCPVDEFDGKFFGLSPMELTLMDPQQRLTLQVLWEALENAGINTTALKNSNTGIFGGLWRQDYKEMLQESGLNEMDFFRTYMGNSLGTLTGRVSHILDITGPCVSTESGCSTSIVAVDMACKSLLKEDCPLALAFGVNLLLHAFGDNALNSIMAPDGHCKTFDESADGFGRAEGCVALVLKRFPDAVRDGDNIHAVIRGSAVVQEGPSRSMGTPTKQCEALAMKLALEYAGVHPKDVSFVETHGTGTPVGDPLEVAAVCEAYSKDRVLPLVIGSVKTNIGHTESCSGIAGIIKTVLALQHNTIPAHRNFTKLNPDIHLERIPAIIPMNAIPWEREASGKPRLAGVSSFGITGTDAHAILQESPDSSVLPPRSLISLHLAPSSSTNILKLSAKSPDGLEDVAASMKKFLKSTAHELNCICYSGNIGRGDFQFRAALVGRSKNEMVEQLQAKTLSIKQAPAEAPKTCFLFTGQGSQYPNMAKQLYEAYPVFRLHFDNCEELLVKNYSISIKEAMWGKEQDSLSRTIYSQTSIFCVEYALFKLWESWGVSPDYVLGHSLGEFAAAVAASILSFEDALKLVAERSRLIDSLPTGKMIVLKEGVERVEALVKASFEDPSQWLDLAAINSPEQTVLAGTENNVSYFAEFCKNNEVKTHILASTHAFHSRMMDPMLEEFRAFAVKNVKFQKNEKCVYASGMEGRILESEEINVDYWVRHTREAVHFTGASEAVLKAGVSNFLEVGPQPVLSALILHNADGVESLHGPVSCFPSIRKNEDELSTLLLTLGKLYAQGVEINWENFHAFSAHNKVALPPYPFQNKAYWFDVAGGRARCIHPLVGTLSPNPTGMKLYQNKLDTLRIPYLKDHVIGNTVIYPGAGFLEMCLVAGHAAYACLEHEYAHPGAAISVEDFLIEAPLALPEGDKVPVQSIVTTEGDTGETKMAIYSRLTLDKETHKWIRHAGGTFSPYAVPIEGEAAAAAASSGGAAVSLEAIRERCTIPVQTGETYDKLVSFGLKFGPTFRSLRAAWRAPFPSEADAAAAAGAGAVGEGYFQVHLDEDQSSYILHPILIDAMLQAIMFSAGESIAEALHVPVSISKFIWYAPMSTPSGYIYCRRADADAEGAIALLFDSTGRQIALMCGALLVETSVSAVLSAVEAQRTSLPSMYEDVWKEELGVWERRLEVLPSLPALFSEESRSAHAHFNELEDEAVRSNSENGQLCLAYMMSAWRELGWSPEVGDTFNLDKHMERLGITVEHRLYTRLWLMELVKEGLFRLAGSDDVENVALEVVRVPPSLPALATHIQRTLGGLHAGGNKEVHAIAAIGSILPEMLAGKGSSLPILFPQEPTPSSAEAFYAEATSTKQNSAALCAILREVVEGYLGGGGKPIIRILEVGAGTGSFTRGVVEVLEEKSGSSFDYTYTDISSMFFAKGEKIFEGSRVRAHYKVFNLEEDPTSQGFVPNSYDVITGSFVVHATQDLRTSLGHLRNLLRPGGLLLLAELTAPTRGVSFTFGTLDGFWRFTDRDIRPFSCELEREGWEMILRERGFGAVSTFRTCQDDSAVILAEASPRLPYNITRSQDALEGEAKDKHSSTQQHPNNVWLVFANREDPFDEAVMERLGSIGRDVRLVYPASSGAAVGVLGRENYFELREEEEEDMRSLFSEFVVPKIKGALEGVLYLWGKGAEDYALATKPFLFLSQSLLTALDQGRIFIVTGGVMGGGGAESADLQPPISSPLWGMGKALHNEHPQLGVRCVDIELKDPHAVDNLLAEFFTQDSESFVKYSVGGRRALSRLLSLKLPNSKLSFPKTERSRLLLPASNAIRDLKFGAVEQPPPIGESEVDVRVKAYALNFRDLFVVIKPDKMFEDAKTVGLDFAGEVVGVGSAVSGFAVGDAVLGLNLNGDDLPSHVRMKEELLVAMPEGMTYCEAATLPAVAATAYTCLISVAKIKEGEHVLIHTGSGGVGLCAIQLAQGRGCNVIATAGSPRKRKYLKNLGVEHVFNSRSTEYEADIRAALGGNRIDVVLNSLTGEGFKEASLAVCAPGARFIEMSKLNIWSEEEVASLRPDVFYKIVDLSAASEDEMKSFIQQIKASIGSAEIAPISYTRFDASDIRDALTHMQKAKHIGKIVCVMPERNKSKGGNGEPQCPLFNDKSTYLVTGGLGGIGFEVAKWMTTSGASHILLIGRNPPPPKIAEEIASLNAKGGFHLTPVACDVGDYDQIAELLDSIRGRLPPLRGIMHAAGVLSDASYENQSWDKYEATFHPKVQGGLNLHNLTLSYPLEHFVMFSSCAGLFGSMGQSNHAAANVFLDSLAHYRVSQGLPAATVNWGLWGQVGVAANKEVVGLKPMSTLQGISALEAIMKSQRLQTAVIDANFSILRKAIPSTRLYLKELKEGLADVVEGVHFNGEKFWEEYDAVGTNEERIDVVKRFLRLIVAQILKLDDKDGIDDDGQLQEMGMDSLMMIEMKNVLQSVVGSRAKITVNAVKDCHTISQLAERVVDLVSGHDEVVPTREEFIQLLREDAVLPESIQCAPSGPVATSAISTVLITGVTGNLGPYVLRELCGRSGITKIYCLLRPGSGSGSSGPQDRLSNILKEKGLLGSVRLDIVECIAGNFITERFGLEESLYDRLSTEVDAVFHLGVLSGWQDIYKRSEPSDRDVRTVNLLGTTNVLQFAVHQKNKHFFHASSTIAASTVDEDGRLWESWPSPTAFDDLPNDAYAVSKFLCELRLAAAVERGLPIKVFRFPMIGGDSESSSGGKGININVLNNQILLRMMSYMWMGVVPAYRLPFMLLPVDTCASLSISVFFHPATASSYELYNISNPHVNDEQELEDIAGGLGHPVEVVEVDAFIDRLEAAEDNQLLVFMKKGMENSEFRDRLQDEPPAPALAWLAGDEEVFRSKKLETLLPQEYPVSVESSIAILKRDLEACKKEGVFKKLGLEK